MFLLGEVCKVNKNNNIKGTGRTDCQGLGSDHARKENEERRRVHEVETVFASFCERTFFVLFQWSESALPLTGKRQRQDATTGAFATVAGVGHLPTK